MATLKDSQEREVDFVGKQYQYWIDKRDSEMGQFVKDFQEYHEQNKAEKQQCEEEMLALYELVQQLTRIISDMETGNYPVSYKSGVKCVQLPPGVKPNLPGKGHRNAFEKMFNALAETKRKAEKYERLMNLKSLNDTVKSSQNATMNASMQGGGLGNWDPHGFAKDL